MGKGNRDSIDNMVDNFGTMNKKNVRQANPTPVAPAPTKRPTPQVPLKQAMNTFNSSNDFLNRYSQPPAAAAKPKAPAAPTAVTPMKPKAVAPPAMPKGKAGRGR